LKLLSAQLLARKRCLGCLTATKWTSTSRHEVLDILAPTLLFFERLDHTATNKHKTTHTEWYYKL
jgi:hypothetical protein